MKWPKFQKPPLLVAALLMGAPIFGGILVWQLWTLDPDRWCKTTTQLAEKADGVNLVVAFRACVTLQQAIITVKDHAIIGLLAVLGLGYVMLMMRGLNMQGEFKGPGGIGASMRSEKEEAAAQVAEAAVHEAEDIISGEKR